MSDKQRLVGDYEIQNLFLLPWNPDGREEHIDLGNTISELNLFESVFEKALTGDVIVRDAFGLPDMLAHRNVFLFLQISRPGANSADIRHLFYIHNAEEYETGTRQQRLAKLEFVSFEYIKNLKSRVTRSFANSSMSGDDWSIPDIIHTLLEDEPPQGVGINGPENENLPLDVAPKEKKFNMQSLPANRVNLVPAKWRPFRCIDFLTHRAVSDDNSPSYLFFERTDGYMLFNVYEGFMQAHRERDKLRPYHNTTANISGNNTGEGDEIKYTQIHDIERKNNEEEIDDTLRGLRGSKLCHLDLLTKQYREYGHDPAREIMRMARIVERPARSKWERLEHDILDPKPEKEYGVSPYRARQEVTGMDTWEAYNQRTFFSPVTRSLLAKDEKKIVYNGEQETERWLQLRYQFLAELELLEYQITAVGRTNYHAGDFIRLYLPSTRHADNNPEKIIDEKRSGIYMVVNIRHQFTQRGHFVHMDVARDSLSSKKHFPVGGS